MYRLCALRLLLLWVSLFLVRCLFRSKGVPLCLAQDHQIWYHILSIVCRRQNYSCTFDNIRFPFCLSVYVSVTVRVEILISTHVWSFEMGCTLQQTLLHIENALLQQTRVYTRTKNLSESQEIEANKANKNDTLHKQTLLLICIRKCRTDISDETYNSIYCFFCYYILSSYMNIFVKSDIYISFLTVSDIYILITGDQNIPK